MMPFARPVAYDDFMTGAFKPAAHCVYIDGARQSNASTDGNIVTTTRARLHVALIDAARRAGVGNRRRIAGRCGCSGWRADPRDGTAARSRPGQSPPTA